MKKLILILIIVVGLFSVENEHETEWKCRLLAYQAMVMIGDTTYIDSVKMAANKLCSEYFTRDWMRKNN